jgi:hypothetical protein
VSKFWYSDDVLDIVLALIQILDCFYIGGVEQRGVEPLSEKAEQ